MTQYRNILKITFLLTSTFVINSSAQAQMNGNMGCRTVYVCPRPFVGCFVPETKILMGDKSEKPIWEIKAGDSVWNPKTSTAVKVKEVVAGPEAIPMYEIGFGDNTIKVTDGHPMVVGNNNTEFSSLADSAFMRVALNLKPKANGSDYRLKPAREISLDDYLLANDGKFYRVTVVNKLPVASDQKVFNLKLDVNSNDPKDHMIVAEGIVTGDLTLQHKLAGKPL